MFTKMKIKIKELAKTAVLLAEETLGSNKGKEKKAMELKYVVDRIPVPSAFKAIISFIFSSFIDDAIELAVEYMEVLWIHSKITYP